MLEKGEFEEYSMTYNICVQAVKDYRREHGTSLDKTPLDELYTPAIEKYEEITGFRGKDAFHLYRKHNVENYGSPCTKCGNYFTNRIYKECQNCGTAQNTQP